jgi:hypothetical protein
MQSSIALYLAVTIDYHERTNHYFATQDITLTILKSLPMILANYHSSKK